MKHQAPVRLLSLDLDGTLLGFPEATQRFAAAWSAVNPGIRPLLVYNTGRSVRDTCALVDSGRLPEPDFILGGLGTELHAALYEMGSSFGARFSPDWDSEQISLIVRRTPEVRKQPAEFLNRYKSSWYWERARPAQLAELAGRLQLAGIPFHLDYSCRHFLDILPACAGKGNSLAWLCQRLNVASDQVVVAGDTAHDSSMFALAGVRGIVVGNALAELRQRVDDRRSFTATAAMADGIVEGLQHYGIFPGVPVLAPRASLLH